MAAPLTSHPQMPGMDMMRRGAGGARASVVGGGHHSLQLDIERLFSQRIRVFDNVSSIANADFLLGTVLKVRVVCVDRRLRDPCLSATPAGRFTAGRAQGQPGGGTLHDRGRDGVHVAASQCDLRETGEGMDTL